MSLLGSVSQESNRTQLPSLISMRMLFTSFQAVFSSTGVLPVLLSLAFLDHMSITMSTTCVRALSSTRNTQRLNIPPRLFDDAINAVLCCMGCNQLGNRVRLPFEPRSQWDLQAFVGLRNDTFTYRFEVIAMLRAKELQFFLSRPWTPSR